MEENGREEQDAQNISTKDPPHNGGLIGLSGLKGVQGVQRVQGAAPHVGYPLNEDEMETDPSNSDVQMFFTRKQNRREMSTGYVIWDGDYERAKFTKKALLEWLSRHVDEMDEDVRNSIRDMKVSERLDTQNISLGDVERTTEDEETRTSIPKNFKAHVNIAESWTAEMHFKAFVARNMDDYGRPQKGYSIILELENARQIKRDLMQFVLERIPDSIPKYYGKLKALNIRKGEEL